MVATIIGQRRVDFTDRSGKAVAGLSLYVTYPEDDVDGLKADSLFIADTAKVVMPVLHFGQEYDFVYEQHGFGSRSRNQLVEIKEV